MATNSASNDPVSLLCKLCDKAFQHKDGPLMLPCLHSFCKPCLEKYTKKEPTADRKMACPTCNDQFPFPKDINQFPVNLRLSHLVETAAYEKQAEEGNVKCQICDDTPKDATTFCCDCCEFYCTKCERYHQKFLKQEEHEFIELGKCKKRKFKVRLPPPKCPQHKEKQIIFCNKCQTLICLYCSQTEHQTHGKSSMNKAARKEKAELQQLINGIDGALGAMDQMLQQLQDTRDNVKVSAKEATKRIDKMCDKLIQAVENRKEVLKKKCQEIAEGKDDVLSNQMVEVQCLRKNLGFAHLQAVDAIDNYSPEEILSVKKAISNRLIQTMETYQQQSMEVREDGFITTAVKIKALVGKIQKVGSFPNIPDPSKCCVKQISGLGKEKKIAVVLMNEADKPVKGKCHFQYKLRRVEGEDFYEYIPPKVTVTQSSNNDGTATLGFTPNQLGEYELTIMARNRPIANPCRVVAGETRDYCTFQNMPATFKNVGGQCFGVAVHDNGTVYASNYTGHTIKVFKPDGTESVIGSSDGAGRQLSSPRGIVLIGDIIYTASSGDHMVKMYSTDGKFIRGFGGYGSGDGQFKNPYDLCTDGKERILVADFYNSRIQFFTRKGIFIRSFRCSSKTYSVAVDPVGTIHVSLENAIGVFSEDGKQIETYNLSGRVQSPTGIHIDSEGNRLIGTERNAVHFANQAGTMVATRQVDGACWGITMDKNGLIFMSEKDNKRISVF